MKKNYRQFPGSLKNVRAKKHLGQHFLKDRDKAAAIVQALRPDGRYDLVIEVGPGMGILTEHLVARNDFSTSVVEIDDESVLFLRNKFGAGLRIIHDDFLAIDLHRFGKPFAVIGNFPYNISTEIVFKVLEHKDLVPEMVGMFQLEVAQRIISPPGNRDYGIPSVLVQAFYNTELMMKLNEQEFIPPPRVKSAVIKLSRKPGFMLQCSEKEFTRVVKTAFSQRRKTLRNALKPLLPQDRKVELPFLDRRAESLSWEDFERLTLEIAVVNQ